jgi:hypothetical protein
LSKLAALAAPFSFHRIYSDDTERPITLSPLEFVNMPHSASNKQKPWTRSDVEELRAFVEEEMSVAEIAHELGRTPRAVRAKAAQEEIPLSGPSDQAADPDND